MLYRLLRALLRHALQIFFRQIEVEGLDQVPATGPLLLAANHPNTLIDVLLVASALDRRVGFVAKSTLFRGPSGWLARQLGAVPVARQVDGPLDEAARIRNQQSLAACEEAVAQGQAILIFPEGISQAEPRLMRLKTGVARIALGAAARTAQPVVVVPVALGYDDPETFRSCARVSYGPPIQVQPFQALANPENDPFAPARALTEALKEGLLDEVLHVERQEHDALLREVDGLYGRRVESEVGGRLAATAAIARALNRFAEIEPQRVERVRGLLEDYHQSLKAAGVEDRALRSLQGPRRPGALLDLAFYGSAPLALWGIVNHLAYYQIPRLLVRLLGPDPLYASTVKLLGGMLAIAGCYALQTWGVWWGCGPVWATIYLGTLPLTGMTALLWLEGRDSRQRASRVRARLRALTPEQVQELSSKRAELMIELDRARVSYLSQELAAEGETSPGAPEDGDPW